MTADGGRPRGTDEVVEALVAAAARLLGDDPPERISGRRLAAEAGVNYGLIHHYFGGKEAVLREGFNRLAESYGAGPEDGSWAPTDPFSMRQRPDFVRALAFASLSGEVYDAHVVHPTIDAALERARRGRPADEDAAVRVDVGIAAVLHLSRCLFESTLSPWIEADGPETAEVVEEHLVLVLRALMFGLDPGVAARGERQTVSRSSAPG